MTAELVMVVPMLLAVTAGLVWMLSVGLAQVRVTDAAREAARALARGDAEGEAIALARSVAPPGSSVEVTRSGGRVTVLVTGSVAPAGGLLDAMPGATVTSTAVAAEEGAG